MKRIAKADFFAGVFLTTILKTSKTAPMYCDATDELKRIEFETDLGAFNVFVHFSASPKPGWDYCGKTKRKREYWNAGFTESQFNYLQTKFAIEGKQNLLAIICTDEKYTCTRVAVLTLREALKCLQEKTDSETRRITVSRSGKDHAFICYGVNQDLSTSEIKPYINHLRYFEHNAE